MSPNPSTPNPRECLLPLPRQIQALPGSLRLTDDWPIWLPNDLAPLEVEAARRFRDECADQTGVRPRIATPPTRRPDLGLLLRIADDEPMGADPRPGCAEQGYHLRIDSDRAELTGRSAVGLFHGVQTLRQLLRVFNGDWPALEIRDYPDYAVRGFYHDVTRGKVPTPATLQSIVDRLSAFKINQLQLYIEHTFAFDFNSNIGRGCSPLTADDIRELDEYCARRHIELVPSLASFGHMGFVLNLPEYRHLAEIEATKTWAEMSWQERMHGLTLDPLNPASRELLTRMYDEFLPLFRSDKMNVTCDETYDLGRGKNAARVADTGVGRLYLDHLHWLGELCAKHGKRMMFWGDIVRKLPEMIADIPKDAVVLDWDYSPDSDYAGPALFCAAGLSTYVCPSTHAWNRALNDLNCAERNIRGFAAAGIRHGAVGLLNTDWGDEGHVNLLASTWHPAVLGASMGWNAAGPSPEVFDRAFARLCFDDPEGSTVVALRRVCAAGNLVRGWPTFCEPLDHVVPDGGWTALRVAEWRAVSLAAVEKFAGHTGAGGHADLDMPELEVACRLSALVAERIGLSRDLAQADGRIDASLRGRLVRFADGCEGLASHYEDVWLARNRRSNLDDILAVFGRLAAEARAAAGE